MKQKIIFIITVFFLWRAGLFAVGAVSESFFSYQPSFAYSHLLRENPLPSWLGYWGGFDGLHYLTIAEHGYFGTGLVQAFFPLFPILLWVGLVFMDNGVLTGLIISNASAAVLLYFFYSWLQSRIDQRTAVLAMLALLSFPSSLFLGAIYNEGMFLLFVIGAFIAADKRRWWLAGILAALASSTRLVGIFLVPALFTAYLVSDHARDLEQLKRKRSLDLAKKLARAVFAEWKVWTPILTGVLGLGAYMLYLWLRLDNPLLFVSVQDSFNTGRQTDFISLPQVYYRYLRILTTVPIDWKWYTYLQDLLLTSLALLALVYAWFRSKLVEKSWIIFGLGALLLPPLTGTFSSMPRYVLVIFPLFILWAELVQRSKLWYSWLAISLAMLIINTMLFIQGWWVA